VFTSPSLNDAELGDIDVQTHEGRIHLHYLSLPSHDEIGHAVSEDGLDFVPAPPPLRTGDPGECDDDQIWTMHTVRNPANGVYHMYYTALSLAEHGQVQRVALATSRDFLRWEKYAGNPVCAAAAPWYNADLARLGRVAFRDPFVYIEDGVWHMLVCATAAGGDRLRSGCVAHATSADGFRWTLQKPLYAPAHMDDLEVPALLKHAGRYYLFLHEFRTPNSPYRIAESLDGPWIAPDYDCPLPGSAMGNNAVFRFCEWRGRTLLYHWHRCQADWHRRSAAYASLLPPKQVNFDPDGAVRLSTFEGWRDRRQGAAAALPPEAMTRLAQGPSAWERRGAMLCGNVVGQMVAAAEPSYDDFLLDVTARLDEGRCLGLIFRASEDLECGYWVRLDAARNRVELHYLQPADSGFHRYVRKQPSLRQTFDTPIHRGRDLRLHLVAAREYVELSVNDRVCLCDATYARTGGRVGVFIENGRGAFGPVTVQPIRPPRSGG
jgi:beta-fructofuranosidase